MRGLVAGAVGTAAMDTLLFRRYRGGGGDSSARDWELSAGLTSWDDAPAPALVGKRVTEGLFQTELDPRYVPLVNNVTHWGFGIANGAVYGIVVGSLPSPKAWFGVPFGASVWSGGYVVLPAAGLYEPIWKYDLKTLANDLSAHLVYGLATAAAFRLLSN
jgi:Protein of unknown function (DUF1440)